MTKRLTDAEIEGCLSEVDTTLKLRYVDKMFARAIEAKVLERSKEEPVAFMRFRGKSISNMSRVITVDDFNGDYPQFMACGMTNSDLVPLYTAPQAVKAEPEAFI
jgi:hypothetical protein